VNVVLEKWTLVTVFLTTGSGNEISTPVLEWYFQHGEVRTVFELNGAWSMTRNGDKSNDRSWDGRSEHRGACLQEINLEVMNNGFTEKLVSRGGSGAVRGIPDTSFSGFPRGASLDGLGGSELEVCAR